MVDIPVVGYSYVLENAIQLWKDQGKSLDTDALQKWWAQIGEWQN